ncbi:MAG: hypothetical protein EPO46_10025 [Lysobacter sp.]|nr:MAG: hypothetical protein EPO46_10025 [Lysobacter sp.]
MSRILLNPFMRWAGKLRHPTLFKITAAVFLLDLVIPDFIPFADEILLGLATMLFANWKSRDARVIDVEHR